MKCMEPEKIVEELDKGLGNGPLVLGIFCSKCNAQFELGRDGAAMAILMNTPFIEYVRWVQSSKCTACGES